MAFDLDDMTKLPDTVPVFPLEGVLLLPRGQVPLNIFEPRYLQMFDDALANGRLLVMVQPYDDESGVEGLQKIGCLGRITSFSETEDGRMIVSLTGVARFSVAEELNVLTPYRQIRADYRPFESDLIADVGSLDVNREGVLDVLKRYLDANGMQADWPAIESSNNEALVNSLCIISPYGAQDK